MSAIIDLRTAEELRRDISPFACQECGRRFKSDAAAARAISRGCPRCGGTDIDLAAVTGPASACTGLAVPE